MIAPAWDLAQLNIARPLAPLDSPELADFMNQLDAINALAEAAPGFVWRLVGDSNNATDVRVDNWLGVAFYRSSPATGASIIDSIGLSSTKSLTH
jgi:hypothetical protein